jgi:hypothetical protein
MVGLGLWYPGSAKARDPHPSDEDLSPGTPDLGHPSVVETDASRKNIGRPRGAPGLAASPFV